MTQATKKQSFKPKRKEVLSSIENGNYKDRKIANLLIDILTGGNS